MRFDLNKLFSLPPPLIRPADFEVDLEDSLNTAVRSIWFPEPGRMTDITSNADHAAYTNSPVYEEQDFSGAIRLPGNPGSSTLYVATTGTTAANFTQGTVIVRFIMNAVPGSDNPVLYWRFAFPATNGVGLYYHNANASLYGFVRGNSGGENTDIGNVSGSPALPVGIVHEAALVYRQSGTCELYQDGALIASATEANAFTQTLNNPIYFGGSDLAYSGQFFSTLKGSILRADLYGRALGADEIARHWIEPTAGLKRRVPIQWLDDSVITPGDVIFRDHVSAAEHYDFGRQWADEITLMDDLGFISPEVVALFADQVFLRGEFRANTGDLSSGRYRR
jgi:hypothetical protein